MSKALKSAGELYAENEELKGALALAEAEVAKWRTGADNMALLYEGLKREVEPMRQVAETAADWLDAWKAYDAGAGGSGEYLRARETLLLATVREYRLKRRIDSATSNLDARAAAEVGVYREGEDVEC